MKVCKPDVNKVSLKSLILQLQLTLELSQFNEILSVYSELLVLIANYSFILEDFSSETQALKEKPVSRESEFISEDPIRDGLNWYGYAGQNPTNYIDRNGLKKDKSGGSKGNKNNQAAPDEDPHITGPGSQDKQAPEYKGKTDNEIDQNIGNDNDGANKIFRGIQKLIVGLHLTKIGISSAQFFMSISAVLVADDGTGVGFIDDGLLAATVIGAVNSEIVAVEGALIAGYGLADVINGAKDISNAISTAQTKQQTQESNAIYRLGSGNGTNLTPRPDDDTGLSYTLVKPKGIPYTETTIEAVNATGVLNAVQDSPTHVSVRPNDMSTMKEWQASRENANTNPHPYTQILQSISVKGIK